MCIRSLGLKLGRPSSQVQSLLNNYDIPEVICRVWLNYYFLSFKSGFRLNFLNSLSLWLCIHQLYLSSFTKKFTMV